MLRSRVKASPTISKIMSLLKCNLPNSIVSIRWTNETKMVSSSSDFCTVTQHEIGVSVPNLPVGNIWADLLSFEEAIWPLGSQWSQRVEATPGRKCQAVKACCRSHPGQGYAPGYCLKKIVCAFPHWSVVPKTNPCWTASWGAEVHQPGYIVTPAVSLPVILRIYWLMQTRLAWSSPGRGNRQIMHSLNRLMDHLEKTAWISIGLKNWLMPGPSCRIGKKKHNETRPHRAPNDFSPW